MTLSTVFTRMFGIQHPIALAPMGGFAGGALAAAVSNGGGLGLVGGGSGRPEWLTRELPIVAKRTSKPWGVGFQTWAIDAGKVERALELHPSAVMFSFGDPRPFTELVRNAGVPLILQVTDLEEASQAVDLGAARRAYEDGVERGDLPPLPIWASQAIDLINDLPSAADLVGTLAAQAQDGLAHATNT